MNSCPPHADTTPQDRHTIQHRAADGTVGFGTVGFGRTNRPVVLDGAQSHRIFPAAGVDHQRSGNLADHPESPLVLGDHKTDEDTEQERPTRINLIDTRSHTMSQVESGSTYRLRSLARGPHGVAVILPHAITRSRQCRQSAAADCRPHLACGFSGRQLMSGVHVMVQSIERQFDFWGKSCSRPSPTGPTPN